jgi:hypothetical protein
LIFAHPQNDRHENEDNRRLIDEHRKGGRDEQYCDLQEEFVVSTGPKQAPPIISAAPVRTMAALNTNIAVTMITATLPKPENASCGRRMPDHLPSGRAQGRARDNITSRAVMSVRSLCVQKR